MPLRSTCSYLLLVLLIACPQGWAGGDRVDMQLAALERQAHGRLGLALIGPAQAYSYRGDEHFAMTSTFKVLLAGAVLLKSENQPNLLNKHIRYSEDSLLSYAPITKAHQKEGMSVAQLCAAAIEWSDNSAANLLLEEIGGPAAVTALARAMGDTVTRLDRQEPELNSAIAGDLRDTTSPRAIATTLHALALGNGLPAPRQKQLLNWLIASKTGAKAIRAGVPAGWAVGDKTGSGAYGTTNDLAIVWPPKGPPFLLAIYFTQPEQNAEARQEVLAQATRIVLASRPN